MKPSSPIIPGQQLPETIYAKDQPQYLPLPVWRDTDGAVLSRWHCTWRERLRILITGDVYLWQLTFNQPLQPVNVEAEAPEMNKRKPLQYWPIAIKWRWRERGYARRYGQRTHRCDGRDGALDAGWVLHLWALKIIFG